MIVSAISSYAYTPIYVAQAASSLQTVQLQQQRQLLQNQLVAEEASKTDSAQVQAQKEAQIQAQLTAIQQQITAQQTQAPAAVNNRASGTTSSLLTVNGQTAGNSINILV
jgi:hypothetical protein